VSLSDIQSVSLTTRFTPLAGLRGGTADGPRVLALHGWLDNAASFLPLMEMLPSLDLVAVDLPGHGLSAHRSADSSYLFVDWVREVFAAADALGWDRFHILGHSMGAGIGSLAAVAQPDRILSLFLLDGFMPVTAEAEEATSRLRDYVHDSLRERRQVSFPTEEAAVGIRARAGDFEHLDGLRRMVARSIEPKGGRFQLRPDRRLHTHNPLRFSLVHIEQLAGALTMPIGVLIAEQGLDFVKDQVRRLAPLVADLTRFTVPGRHHVHLDAPGRVAPLVGNFFTGARPR
jgi:pimeloyl-ACP methyl ester carboxylesterase